jgi:hypothetical protein
MSNNGDNKLLIECPHCHQRFSVPLPKVEVLNTPRVSMTIATHEKPIRCICGSYSVLGVEKYKLAWAVVPITDEQAQQLDGSRIILPPPGLGLVG